MVRFEIFKQMLVNIIDKFSSLIGYNNLCASIPKSEETKCNLDQKIILYVPALSF